MDKGDVQYETQLVIAESQAQYFEQEMRNTRDQLIKTKVSVDRLLDEISDLEQKNRSLKKANDMLQDTVNQLRGQTSWHYPLTKLSLCLPRMD